MIIIVNSLYEIRNDDLKVQSIERVLWVNPEQTDFVTLNVSDDKSWPQFRKTTWLEEKLQNGLGRRLEKDPYLPKTIRFENLKEESIQKRLKLRDEAWSCIKALVELEPYIFEKTFRYEQIKELKERTGKEDKYIYKHLRNYWLRGKSIDALFPRFEKCGGRGKRKNPKPGRKMGRKRKTAYIDVKFNGINVDKTIRNIFDAAITEHYKKREKHAVRFAYCKMLSDYYYVEIVIKRGVPTPILKEEHEVPSLDQFRYYLRTKENQLEILKEREGERAYHLKFRPKLSNSTQRALGPGHIFEIDATVADVYLVSADRTKIIGRPVVYIIIDVFTRLIGGFYVGLEGPSWIGAMMAIDNLVANKVEFCAEYDIPITEEQWPCHYLPEFFQADRGEMEGKMSDSLPGIGTFIMNAPPYRADLKGIIEQRFRTVNIKIGPYMPGRVKEEYKVRGGPDYVLDAKLTLRGFTRMMIEMIISYNNNQYIKEYPGERAMIPENVLPVPIHLWNWGIKNKGGFIQERPREFVRNNMLPRATGSVTGEGIVFNKMRFASKELNERGWFVDGKSHKQQIIYDPRCLNYVYVEDRDGRFIPCELLPNYDKLRNRSLEEIKMIQFDDDVQEIFYRSVENQAFADLDAQLKHIVNEETEKTEEALREAGTTNTERRQEMKEGRKKEKNELRVQQAFVPQTIFATPEKIITAPEEASNYLANNDIEVDKERSIFELLSELSDEEDEDEFY